MKGYNKLAKVFGWFLLVVGGGWLVLATIFLAFVLPRQAEPAPWPPSMIFELVYLRAISHFILPGFLAFSLIQFFRYLTDLDFKPTWVLMKSYRALYLWAALQLIWIFIYALDFPTNPEVLKEPQNLFVRVFIGNLAPGVIRFLILIGLGHAVRRLLPILEESRTLV